MEKNQYLEVFIEESKEHLQSLNTLFLKLEKEPEDINIVKEIFRSAHTLKGMSAALGYEDLTNLTHVMENVFDKIRNEKLVVTTDILDVLFSVLDDLEAMIGSIANNGDGKRNVTENLKKLETIEKGEQLTENTPKEETSYSTTETYNDSEISMLLQALEQGLQVLEVKISLQETCLLKATRVFMVFDSLKDLGEVFKSTPTFEDLEEEKFEHEFKVILISDTKPEEIEERILNISEIEKVKIEKLDSEAIEQKIATKPTTQTIVSNTNIQISETKEKKNQSSTKEEKNTSSVSKTIRVNIERLDSLMNLFEEMVIDRGRLEQISREVNSTELTETVEHMSRVSGDLQNIILNMRMVPIEQVFNRFPRMVRGLSKDLNKKINLEILGADTELDRTVIDEIGDPLVHLLRNSIDHGIEAPETRLKNGKSETGNVTLKAYHSGNHVFIKVTDDGAGIDREKVLKKAIENGVISKEKEYELTDKQVYELLFSSGLSTAKEITDVSGRGVGLDVVKNKIQSLGGTVTIDSTLGEGTTFLIQLPLTLSIISTMLVEVQEEKYAIPLSSIIETTIIKKEDILAAHNQKVIDFRGHVVPLLDLTDFFEVPKTREQNDFHAVVIVRKGEKMAGLVVDSFIGQQEIVLKSLGNYLTDVFAISGATILGNGQVALVVDCNALIA